MSIWGYDATHDASRLEQEPGHCCETIHWKDKP